tara:strand:+ start:1877 stop:2452 length:576 start_codon:yes stop_codon:yes gene_type:complete
MRAVDDGRPWLFYSERDSQAAHRTWKANCGPHSIAAMLGLSLDHVREHLVEFPGWMSPMMVGETLRHLGAEYTLRKGMKTRGMCVGLNRVQWEGSWLNPGVPAAAAYAHTHWVAHVDGWVLCSLVDPASWVPFDAWEREVAKTEPPWHVTHHYGVAVPDALRTGVQASRIATHKPASRQSRRTGAEQVELL